MNIREQLDRRHLMQGIDFCGLQHQVNNLMGRHDIHVGDVVMLHLDGGYLIAEIRGEVNKHFVGELLNSNGLPSADESQLPIGKLITFDEMNIFECYERHAS